MEFIKYLSFFFVVVVLLGKEGLFYDNEQNAVLTSYRNSSLIFSLRASVYQHTQKKDQQPSTVMAKAWLNYIICMMRGRVVTIVITINKYKYVSGGMQNLECLCVAVGMTTFARCRDSRRRTFSYFYGQQFFSAFELCVMVIYYGCFTCHGF